MQTKHRLESESYWFRLYVHASHSEYIEVAGMKLAASACTGIFQAGNGSTEIAKCGLFRHPTALLPVVINEAVGLMRASAIAEQKTLNVFVLNSEPSKYLSYAKRWRVGEYSPKSRAHEAEQDWVDLLEHVDANAVKFEFNITEKSFEFPTVLSTNRSISKRVAQFPPRKTQRAYAASELSQ
ncbi:hypothetical protein ACCC98_27035 [Rhizobium pisi]|uniref:hypothetical protein n=1 Tax=Rhizobium pisi TaxID=574561 RepID=UPI0039B01415